MMDRWLLRIWSGCFIGAFVTAAIGILFGIALDGAAMFTACTRVTFVLAAVGMPFWFASILKLGLDATD